MFFIDELKKLQTKNNVEKIKIYVDMDGVIADYRFGEGKNIQENRRGTYINKRPLITTINNLSEISKLNFVDLYILSSCLYQEQATEKDKWLDLHANYFDKNNRIYIISNSFENRKQMKIDRLKKEMLNDPKSLYVLVEDTHEILFMGIKQLNELFVPFHVSTLLD